MEYGILLLNCLSMKLTNFPPFPFNVAQPVRHLCCAPLWFSFPDIVWGFQVGKGAREREEWSERGGREGRNRREDSRQSINLDGRGGGGDEEEGEREGPTRFRLVPVPSTTVD